MLRAATVTVLGAGVVTGTGAGILRALNSEDGSGDGRLLLQTDATSGVGILEKVRERKDPRHKPISQWIVCRNQEAIELMIAVYPHMGVRRQAKIREVLAQVEKDPA